MSADLNELRVGKRASVGHSGAGSATGGVEKWGRGFGVKDEIDETDIRLFSEEPFPLLGSDTRPPKLKDYNKVHGPAPKRVTPNARPTSNARLTSNAGPTANIGPTANTGPTANIGPTANAGPNRTNGKQGDKKGQDMNQLKLDDDRIPSEQNDTQDTSDGHGRETKTHPDTGNPGGRQHGGGHGRPPGWQHQNERDQTDRYGPQNKRGNLKSPQHAGGRGTGGRGPGPGPGPGASPDRNPRRASSGTIPEGGGVFVEDPPQTTGHNGARDRTGAGSGKPNRQGHKVPRPDKPQRPPNPSFDTKNAELESKNAELESKNAELESKNAGLETTICEMDEQIFGLKETISRLHRRDGDPTKADSHFATGFSDISCAIEQWVLQHCPHGPADPDIGSKSTELQELLCTVSCEPEKNVGSHRVRVVSAVVAQLLLRRVFSSPFPGAPETAHVLQEVVSRLNLQGTFYQCQRWRALTMSVLAKGDDFEGGLTVYVDCVTEDLGALLSILSPPAPDNSRREKGLRDIVEKAVKLTIEIHKQPDLISLNQVVPGSPYSAEYMEDTSCMYTDSELEEGMATVKIQMFPTILRRPCVLDESQPVVVMKAKILAELPSRGEVPVE